MINSLNWLDTWGQLVDLIGCLGANSLKWLNTRGQLLDMVEYLEWIPWLGWMPVANSFIYFNVRGQLLDLVGCLESIPWFGWIPGSKCFIWLDARDKLLDSVGCLGIIPWFWSPIIVCDKDTIKEWTGCTSVSILVPVGEDGEPRLSLITDASIVTAKPPMTRVTAWEERER